MKAIDTEFDGYRFRSRLEARWAVFFKTLGIKYEYEKEGYDLDGTWYLPDLWLPKQDCWIEIKAEQPTEEENEKARRLAKASGKPVFIVWGQLAPNDIEVIDLMPMKQSIAIFNETGKFAPYLQVEQLGQLAHRFSLRGDEIYLSDTLHHFTECPTCGRIELAYQGLLDSLTCNCHAQSLERVLQFTRERDMMGLFLKGEEYKKHLKALCNATRETYAQVKGDYSSRLLAAYSTARQARFEHR